MAGKSYDYQDSNIFCTKGYNWNKNRVEYNPAFIYII